MKPEEVLKYDKYTYFEKLDDLNYGQFLRLILDPDNYDDVI
jgi:hypothetical protein